jgi:hypothetical protein
MQKYQKMTLKKYYPQCNNSINNTLVFYKDLKTASYANRPITQPEDILITKLFDNTLDDISKLSPEKANKIHSFDVLMQWNNEEDKILNHA